MPDAETQDSGLNAGAEGGGSTVVRRQSTLMNNITREARQSHQLLSYPRKSATLLATLHILIGAVCIACMSVHVYDCYMGCKAVFWSIGYGIWSGVLFIFTGSFGLWTSRHSYRGTVAFYCMMCVVTACECSLPFSFAVCDSVYSRYNSSDPKKLWRVMIAIVAAFSILEALLAIMSSILCIRTLCRKTKKKNPAKYMNKTKASASTVDSGN